MALRPEQRCEATITYKTLQQPAFRKGLDFEGRSFDLGSGVVDQPGIEEATVSCERCPIADVVLRAEGNGPYGASNAIRRDVKEFIGENCKKLKQAGYLGIPQDWHPNI